MVHLTTKRARRRRSRSLGAWWRTHRRWLVALLIPQVAVLLGFVAVSAAGGGPGVPLDDAWIHFAFARNLAQKSALSLNPPSRSGGPTSLLWTLLLALPAAVRVPPLVTALVLGGLLHLCVTVLLFRTGQDVFREYTHAEWYAGAVALAFGLGGNAVWLALSGMETWLFLSFGLGACLAYANSRWSLAGALAAGAVLTRPEGCLLLVALGLDAAIRRWRRDEREAVDAEALLKCLAPGVLAFAIVVVTNANLTGQPFPSTLGARRWLAGLDPDVGLASRLELIPHLGRLSLSWGDQIIRWVLAGRLVEQLGPAQAGAIGLGGRNIGVGVLLWGVPCLLLATIGVVGVLSRWILPTTRRQRVPPDPMRPLLLWLVVHMAFYALLLPWAGNGGRYQPMVFPLLMLFAGLGWAAMAHPMGWLAERVRLGRAVRHIATVAAAIISLQLLAALGLWGCIYAGSVRQIEEVQVASSWWVAENVSLSDTVAAFDLGAIAYYGKHRLADIAGLTDPKYLSFLRNGRVASYMDGRGARYLALPENPEQPEGSIGERLGLLGDDLDPSLRLRPLETFRAEHWTCGLGVGATVNAYPQITVYELQWQSAETEGEASPKRNSRTPTVVPW